MTETIVAAGHIVGLTVAVLACLWTIEAAAYRAVGVVRSL
jgi:hypothetical protein